MFKYKPLLVTALFVFSLQVQANPADFLESTAWQNEFLPIVSPVAVSDADKQERREKRAKACEDKKTGDSCTTTTKRGDERTGTCKERGKRGGTKRLVCVFKNRPNEPGQRPERERTFKK